METVAGNPFDYDVEGIVVFRAFAWPFQTFMSEHMVDLVEEVYNGKGLVRRVCNHQGSFYMNGNRQTSQASSTMTAPSRRGTDNQYYNPATTNVSFLPLAQSFINRLAEEAQQTQLLCGQFMLHVLTKILKELGPNELKVYEMCKSTIITIAFMNSLHKDCDGMSKKSSDLVKQYLEKSFSFKIRNWYKSFKALYGMKQALPLPTTCCWYPLRSSDTWYHHSYFIILSAMFAYDLSNNQCEPCYGATFFGSLISHGTSAPLWISRDGSLVTVVCPEDKLYNAAWGRSGGYSEESKRRKQQERVERERQRQRTGR